MRASDLKPLHVPREGEIGVTVETVLTGAIERLNDLLAILQEQEQRIASPGHGPDCLCETPGCLGSTTGGRDAILRMAYARADLALGRD
jgi:hypothetical protein